MLARTPYNVPTWLVVILAVLVFLAPMILGDGTTIDPMAWCEFAGSRSFRTEIDAGGQGHTIVEAWREPLVAGTFRITPAVASKSTTHVLQSMRFLVADDADQDGLISAVEWSIRASADAVVSGPWRKAIASPVVVSAFHDVYRIESTWLHEGAEYVSADTMYSEGIEEAP